MFDTLIFNGKVFDGTRFYSAIADIGITGGIIQEIAPSLPRQARQLINAAQQIVSPGFIDLHSHGDLIFPMLPEEQLPRMEARLRQGITTEIVGNCGLSPILAEWEAKPLVCGINAWMTPPGQDRCFGSVEDYLNHLSRSGIVVNVGVLIGHGPVRISVMGLRQGEPVKAEQDAMQRLVAQGLDEGAFGLSTGLIYPPGMFSSTEELTGLARIVAQYDGVFTCHVRGSSETLLQAATELISIGRSSGAHVHHSHHEAVGQDHWFKVEKTLGMEEAARESDLDITSDMFPYVAAATMMLAIYPPWALEGGLHELVRRLKDPVMRRRIRKTIEETVPKWPPWLEGGWPHNLVRAVGWDQIEVASVCHTQHKHYEGRQLAALASNEGKDPFEFISDLMVSEEGKTGQLIYGISGDRDDDSALRQILSHPLTAICTDANDFGKGRPHPAAAGSFVRVLGRYVRKDQLLDLETALAKMTSYPASILRLPDRGHLNPGYAADLVVFDPNKVCDRATFEDPTAGADGVSMVMINGHVAVRQGRLTGAIAGQILRHC